MIVVRPANRDDVEGVCRVLAEAFEPYRAVYTAHAYDSTVLSAREVAERIDDAGGEVLVAVSGDDIVGTVSVETKSAGNLYLRSMAVRPDHRGKGVGRRMLEALEGIAGEKSCTVLSLECYEALEDAIALYEKFGFLRTGKTRPYGGITVFEMVKKLDPMA